MIQQSESQGCLWIRMSQRRGSEEEGVLRVQVADTGERLDRVEVLVLQSVITTRSQ